MNVEINETHSLNEVYEALNRTKKRISRTFNILINIEIYSVNIFDEEIVEVREKIRKISKEYDNVIGMHGFYLNRESKFIKMDLLIDFEEQDAVLLVEKIRKRIEEEEKEYKVVINIDRG
jgi:divalent metal cation (Fe/Co/Zn/Cd) transporter